MPVLLRGKILNISRKDFEEFLNCPLKGDRKTKYYAIVSGRRFPAKRLLYEVLKKKGYTFTLQEFTTEDAVRILKSIGIEVREFPKEKDLKPMKNKDELLKFAGILQIGGNAIEEEQKLYSA